MALGAYSVVRYSDSLRDERVNLGVVVWHPSEGFAWRVLPATELNRIRAVNPVLRAKEIQNQIGEVETQLEGLGGSGKDGLAALSRWLRDGLQVSAPFPARIHSANETADRLFSILVRRAEATEAKTRDSFDAEVSRSIRETLYHIDPSAAVEDIGDRQILGVRVTVGLRTRIRNRDALWRSISLRSHQIGLQVERAKAVASDIRKLKLVDEYEAAEQIVAAHTFSKPDIGTDEAEKWLADEGAKVLKIPKYEAIPATISAVLQPAS
jgi:hypothetical protein